MQRHSQFCTFFPRHQPMRRSQAARGSFHRDWFVDNEVRAFTKNIANLFTAIDEANNQGGFIERQFADTRNKFDGRGLILAINHDGVEVLGRNSRRGSTQLGTVFHPNAQLFKNLTQNLHRILVRADHQ